MTASDDITTITASADSLAARLAPRPGYRYCSTCRQTKALDDFGILRRDPTGHRGTCRDCVNERQRAFRSTPEGKAANLRAWYKSNAKARALRNSTGTP